MRTFVDRAHALGLGVILDVVYNHLGPDGNYLKEFSADYFTDRYANEWGDAINFDGTNSRPVREFFVSNASYWVEEFHLDGLRLDATQQIFDSSPENILAFISREGRRAAGNRSIVMIAENETQRAQIARQWFYAAAGRHSARRCQPLRARSTIRTAALMRPTGRAYPRGNRLARHDPDRFRSSSSACGNSRARTGE